MSENDIFNYLFIIIFIVLNRSFELMLIEFNSTLWHFYFLSMLHLDHFFLQLSKTGYPILFCLADFRSQFDDRERGQLSHTETCSDCAELQINAFKTDRGTDVTRKGSIEKEKLLDGLFYQLPTHWSIMICSWLYALLQPLSNLSLLVEPLRL